MTKKFLVALTMFAMLFVTSTALAAYEENVEEGVDLTTIKKLAIAYPNFYRVDAKEPTIEDLTKDLYEAGKIALNTAVISYEEIATAIRRDTGVDLASLQVDEAEKIFKENVGKYADAYLVETVTNGGARPWFFFNVYNAADSSFMYTYTLQSKYIGKNTKDYRKVAETFYKQFAAASEKTLSREDKKKLDDKKRREKSDKKKLDKVTQKAGKSKEDLVKKK